MNNWDERGAASKRMTQSDLVNKLAGFGVEILTHTCVRSRESNRFT
jgi:hypothetical protein